MNICAVVLHCLMGCIYNEYNIQNRALEELRASHNQISEVPASLAANIALRTLDLGHNEIGEWRGLEKLGKSLTSLVQLSLSGNPLCASATGVSVEDDGGDDETYVTKVMSMFPALKVRDAKRVLKKKSHTYYEQRAMMELDGAEKGGARVDNAKRETPGDGGRGREVEMEQDGPKSKSVKKKSKKITTREEQGSTKTGGVSKSSQGGVAEMGIEREEEAVVTGRKASAVKNDHERHAKRKRKSDGGGVSLGKESVTPHNEESTEPRSSKSVKKKKIRAGDEGAGSGVMANGNQTAVAVAEPEVASLDTTDSLAGCKHSGSEEQRRKKNVREKNAKKRTSSTGLPSSSSKDDAETITGSIVDKDPYSSSEELPIPGAQRQRAQHQGGNHPGNTVAGVQSESGVVAVVVNHKSSKKKKNKRSSGNKVKVRTAPSQRSGSGEVGEGDGEGGSDVGEEEGGGFSMESMLMARESCMGPGVGGGVSAWD